MSEAALQTSAPAEEQRANRFAAIIIAGHALKHIYISAFTAAILPELKIALNLSSTQIGAMATVRQFSSWGSTVTTGYLGDRFISKTGLLLGTSLALTGISYFFLGISGTYSLLLASMLLVGLGPSIYHPPAIGALSRRFSSRRAFFISLHGAGGSVGEAAGPLIGGGLIALLYWRDVLQFSMVPALIGAFIMWTLLKNDHAEDNNTSSMKQYLTSFKQLLKLRSIQMIYLATALRTVGQATTIVFLPIYMREDLGYSAFETGVFIAMAQVIGIGSQPVMGQLTDRIGYKRVLLPALLAFALILALIPVASSTVQLAVVVLLLGTFLFSLHAILISAAAEFAGEALQSTSVSLIYSAGFIGALSPTIAGVLGDAYGLGTTFVFAAILVALAGVTIMFTNLPGSRAQREA